MNIKIVSNLIGRLLIVEAILMLLSVIVGLIYKESFLTIGAFLIASIITFASGLIMNIPKPKDKRFYIKEGMLVISLAWFLMSFFGGLPLLFSKSYPSLVDSFFEVASGFTTTGASVATDVESFSHSILFWRSFTHLVGGMGVLVFTLAISPFKSNDDIHLMKAEVPGPVFGKIASKLVDTARLLYKIYLAMTFILILILWACKMPFFDSMLHAFGTAGTGGFGIKSSSIAYYKSPLIEYVISVAMILFGINFNLYYLILMGKVKHFFKDEELRWYLGILFVAVAMITINTLNQLDFSTAFRDALFTVSSLMTTTGYATVDYDMWPTFSKVILLILMFVGASAGSTAGGIKVSRIATMIKSGLAEIKRTKNPDLVVHVKFNKDLVDQKRIRALGNYLFLYFSFFVVILLIVAVDAPNFESAFSAVAATFNNIGPGMDLVGPTQSYAGLNNISKIALSFGVIAGRLEILPVLVLLSPSTWRKK